MGISMRHGTDFVRRNPWAWQASSTCVDLVRPGISSAPAHPNPSLLPVRSSSSPRTRIPPPCHPPPSRRATRALLTLLLLLSLRRCPHSYYRSGNIFTPPSPRPGGSSREGCELSPTALCRARWAPADSSWPLGEEGTKGGKALRGFREKPARPRPSGGGGDRNGASREFPALPYRAGGVGHGFWGMSRAKPQFS